MCTFSWARSPGAYRVYFNRDELRTRRPEVPPVIFSEAGVSFVAPSDGGGEGTWIGVNQFGVSVCLLNDYPEDFRIDPQKNYTSRGLLVRSLLKSSDPETVQQAVSVQSLGSFRPFLLAVAAVDHDGLFLQWDGRMLSAQSLPEAATSSSYRCAEVRRTRLEYYDRLKKDLSGQDFHAAFHQSRYPEAGPFAVCMQREDAQTFSHSRISVAPDQIEFCYQPFPGGPGGACRTILLKPQQSGSLNF